MLKDGTWHKVGPDSLFGRVSAFSHRKISFQAEFQPFGKSWDPTAKSKDFQDSRNSAQNFRFPRLTLFGQKFGVFNIKLVIHAHVLIHHCHTTASQPFQGTPAIMESTTAPAASSSYASASTAAKRTSPTALRPLSAELGTLARSDASAYFSFGALNVVASVSGPTEVRIRDELTDRATLDVIYQPQHGVAGIPAQAVSDSLFTAFSSVLLLHHHPRSLIQVVLQTLSSPSLPQSSVQVMHKDVGPSQRYVARQPLLLGPDNPPSVTEQAALINAASLALLDAGIPARGSVAACACAILPAAQGTVLRQNSHLAEISESHLAGLVRQYQQENGESDDIEVDDDDAEESHRIIRTRKRYTGE